MDTHYTAERNAQIVLYLLKTNNTSIPQPYE